MNYSIFRKAKGSETKATRFKFIHYTFKKNLFVPFLKICEKILDRYMVKKRWDIPNEIYNKNFFILWDTIEEGIKEWWFTFKRFEELDYEHKQIILSDWDDRENRNFYRFYKFLLKLHLTIALEDTAYRELTNVLMFKLQGMMNKEWNPEIEHKFPLYIARYDQYTHYFKLMEGLNENK